MQNNEVKKIDFQLKEESEGKVSAVFSVFNSLDSDGDVVEPGAIKSGFKSGNVPMVWAHKWDMPIGKGYITEDNDKATFTGEFFMDTESGQEAYKIVKNMGDMQQWSFGYRVNDSEYGKLKKDGSDNEEDVRFLKDLTVFEVSPVLVGANQETYTLAIKSNNDLLKDINEDVKSVMTTESMNQPDPNEKQEKDLHEDNLSDNEEQAMKLLNDMANDMKVILNAIPLGEDADLPKELKDSVSTLSERAKTIGNIFTTEEIFEDPAKALAAAEESGKTIKIVDNDGNTYYKVSDIEEDVEEGTTVSFSRQVKDVLAAFNDLMARATAIAMLRAKDGRKLGEKATEALRAVQEDLQDAWVELDQFIDNVGENTVVTEESVDVEEELPADEVEDVSVEEPAEEVEDSEEEESAEEVEVESDPETEPVEAEDNTESVNDEDEALWLEAQQNIAESLDAELEVEDNI